MAFASCAAIVRKKSRFVSIELARHPLPGNQYARDMVVMDQGYAEKGSIALFPACSRRHVARMSRRVRYRHQLAALRDQTKKTFLSINANLA
jgi:hypothetical protein